MIDEARVQEPEPSMHPHPASRIGLAPVRDDKRARS